MKTTYYLFLCLSVLSGSYSCAAVKQPTSFLTEVEAFQTELNAGYADEEHSPLSKAQRVAFNKAGGHPFFPPNDHYRIVADFKIFEDPAQIELKTSTARMAEYDIYGEASFTLNGQEVKLNVYQSQSLINNPAYANHLFLPFRDLTSGEETYGGGRYIDLTIPEDPTKIVIDFNKAYQPYCAYSYNYSCPVPPAENFIDLRIVAGVKHLDLGH